MNAVHRNAHTLYARLAEECGEVVQICMKILRFGINDCNPNTGVCNEDALLQECADVLVCIDNLGLDPKKLEIAKQHKRDKIERYKAREIGL